MRAENTGKRDGDVTLPVCHLEPEFRGILETPGCASSIRRRMEGPPFFVKLEVGDNKITVFFGGRSMNL